MRTRRLTEQEDAARHRRPVHRRAEPARPERGDLPVDGLQPLEHRGVAAAPARYRHGSSRIEWIQPSERGAFEATFRNPSAHAAAAAVAERTASR